MKTTTTTSAFGDPLFERLHQLRPQIAKHIRLLPQTYRGERWYVLADETNNQYQRFNARSYAAIGRFDGRVTLAEIRASISRQPDALSEAELASLVMQLASINALSEKLPEEVLALTSNGAGQRRSTINPLALRFKLFDPDSFLDIAMPWLRPLFSKSAAMLWAAIVVLALFVATANLHEISRMLRVDLLTPYNLVMGWVVYTIMKVIHEFAHAFAVKHWGGEVHEMGISLLVLLPVPYVDASSSWTFRSKHRRAFVGAIGVMTELLIAAIALFVFVAVEPGFVRSIALNAMIIGAFSSLLVNGNPLLRFDGYYVLQDMIEMPNLSTRASRYVHYFVQRYLLGITGVRSQAGTVSERRWLLVYGITAGLYRIFILAVIALFLASKYLVAGVALVVWVVLLQIVLPLVRSIKFMISDQSLAGQRVVANGRAALLVAGLVGILMFVPVRHSTVAQGIVWLPEQTQIFAQTSGILNELYVEDGQIVKTGDKIAHIGNPDLQLQRQILSARINALDARRMSLQFRDRTAADALVQERLALTAEMDALDEELAALVVLSPNNGTIVLGHEHSTLGSHIAKGEQLAYVVDPQSYIVRSVVPQKDIGKVRKGVIAIEVRLAERLEQVLPAEIVRETPAGNTQLVSRALSVQGGGNLPTETADGAVGQTLAEVFDIDLSLPPGTRVSGIGGRAYVRYQHEPQPLLMQWHQRLRQLLLRRLAV